MAAADVKLEIVEGLRTSVASLLGLAVVDGAGKRYGRVKELAVDVGQDGARVAAVLLQHPNGKAATAVSIAELEMPVDADAPLQARRAPVADPAWEDSLLMERDLLDQQIIDVDGRKVVRVNDVNLVWERGDAGAVLRIDQVEVGMQGALRRLLHGLPRTPVETLARTMPARLIPWGCVDLIDRDPARRVKLKIGQDRLSKLHPSDIAEILEGLAPAEREAVFISLDEETQAETLEEFEPWMQKEILEGMDSERAAEILEEMDPGAAADVLAELDEDKSDAILEEIDPEVREDVEHLMEYSEDSAAGRMTTDYFSAPAGCTVEQTVDALREFEGDPDTVTEVYLVDEHGHLESVVSMSRLLLAERDEAVKTLAPAGRPVTATLHTGPSGVAELFDKYNLRSLPVLDHRGMLAGVVHAEQVIAQLREG